MIEVQGLTKQYGPVTAIRDVSFNVAAGEIVGFLGPNGAGKSTTMRILSCFMPATQGSARVAGYDVCSGVIIINKGSIVAQGPIDTLVDEFFPSARVQVEIEGPRDLVRERLASIPGVTAVKDDGVDGAGGMFLVESPRGRDVRSEIF